ncbi:hypothetical protein A2U01_0081876, partial [Trifolium medium]|nr:hypothetical protein [Trifolium medium]
MNSTGASGRSSSSAAARIRSLVISKDWSNKFFFIRIAQII